MTSHSRSPFIFCCALLIGFGTLSVSMWAESRLEQRNRESPWEIGYCPHCGKDVLSRQKGVRGSFAYHKDIQWKPSVEKP